MAQLPFELDLIGSPPNAKATKEQLETGINASIAQAYADFAAADSAAVAGLAQVAQTGDYNDLGGKPSLGTAAAQDVGAFATAAQGAKADTAIQPNDLAGVATSGSYADLTGKPTLGALAEKSKAANTDLADMDGGTIKGRDPLDGSGPPQDLLPTAIKRMIGLDLVDNTRDIDKPVSAAVATLLAQKVDVGDMAGYLAGTVMRNETYAPQHRPGDAPRGFGVGTTGRNLARHYFSTVSVPDSGNGLRVVGASTIAPQDAVAVVPGRIYSMGYVIRRAVDPSDPLSDAVQVGVAFLNSAYAPVGEVLVRDGALRVIDGTQRQYDQFFSFSVDQADHDIPPNAVYARPFVRTYGSQGQTDVFVVRLRDETEAWRSVDAVKQIEGFNLPDLTQLVADTQQAAQDAMDAAALAGVPYASRADFLAATPPLAAQIAAYYCPDGYLLSFRRDAVVDPSLAAAVTADGACWSPDTICTWDHFGAVGDGLHADGAAMQRTVAWACAVARPGTAATVHYLANRIYLQEAATGVIDATSSINLVGPGPWACTHKRLDYKDRPVAAGRRDWIRCLESGARLRMTGVRFEGEFGDPLTIDGNPVTVAYRFGGGNQYEGYLAGGSTDTIVLLAGPDVLDVDGAYVGHQVQIDHGPGVGAVRTITAYVGSSRTATLDRPLNGGAAATSASYVQIGGYPHGIAFVMQNLAEIEISGCVFTEMRNQILNHTNCAKVRVTDCLFERCARGGVSGRRNTRCIYSRCMFVDCSDDTIFNSHEGLGSGESIETLVSDCIVINCMGFRFIGARRLRVSNIFFVRPIGHAILIGHSSGQQPVNQHGIHVSGVQIFDPIDRNALAFDLTEGMFAPIRVLTASSQESSEFVVPGVVASGNTDTNDPAAGDALRTVTASTPPAYFQPLAWGRFDDIHVVQTLRPGHKVSDWNGRGTFYFLGTLLTNGYIDVALTMAEINCPGFIVAGPLHNVDFTGVVLNCYGTHPSFVFQNRQAGGITFPVQYMRIDFDRALTGITFRGCRFSGGSNGVRFAHGSMSTNYVYDVRFLGCDFDLDPYHQHSGRSRTAGVVDGGWIDGTPAWCIDANRVAGLHVEGCTFRNTPNPFRALGATRFFGNRVFARVGNGATPDAWHAGNKGVGAIPVDGAEFSYVDTDCDPRSATYLQPGNINLTSATMPTSGWWMAGQRVRCSDPATGVAEWVRVTTGSTHALVDDWLPVDVGGSLNINHFGADPTGTNDSATAIEAALIAAKGKLVVGSHGANYKIATAIRYDGSVNLDLSMSRIVVPADILALDFRAPTVGPFAVSSDYDISSAPLSLATAELPFTPKAGQVVWIASKALDPGDRDKGSAVAQYRVGEAFRLGSGSTTTALVLQAPLAHSIGISPTSTAGDESRIPAYTTGMETLIALPDMSAKCDIRLPVIEYEDGHDADWNSGAVSLWGYVNPTVEVGGVTRGYGPAVRLWGTYGATVRDVSVSNLTDNTSNGQFGYGVADGGWNTRVIGLTAHNTRHGYTTSKSSSSYTTGTFDAWKILTYGRTAGAQIFGGIASGGSAAMWDTHHDAQDILFDGNVADGGAGNAFAIRGRNITIANPVIRNCGAGIRFFTEYDSGDPDDDIYLNGKLVSDFTSGVIDSPQMDVRQACIDVRASTVLLSGSGRYTSQAGCVIYNSGGTLAIGGTHRMIVNGSLTATDGVALIHLGASNSFSAGAFPEPNIVIDGVLDIDARSWTGSGMIGIKTHTGTKVVVRGLLRLLLPAGATLFSGGNSEIVCEGSGRIEYSIAGSAGIVTGLASRSIYLKDITSGAIMDGTTNRNDYFGYTQVSDQTANTATIIHGGGTASGLRLKNTDTAINNGEAAGSITFETNDESNPAINAARILARGAGTLGFVELVFQRTNVAGNLYDALVLSSKGDVAFYKSDGTTQGVLFNATTGILEISSGGFIDLPVYTVSALPLASSSNTGAKAFVSDATGTTFRDIVVGGGSNFVPVFSDGTNWRIG